MKTINIIKSLILLVLFSTVLSSCKKDYETKGISKITYYPKFEMTGDDLILSPLSTPFTDPGVKAVENGKDIPVTTSVLGTIQPYSGTTVNTDLANEYVVTYSATNSDGFKGSTERTVWVAKTGDLVNSIEGLYTSTVVRNGISSAQYRNMPYVLIYKTGANTYRISDAIGGYYAIGRGYGITYRAIAGNITANNIATNSFSYPGSFGAGDFGGTANMSEMTVNPGAKTVSFKTVWDTGTGTVYTFLVTLKQVTL